MDWKHQGKKKALQKTIAIHSTVLTACVVVASQFTRDSY